MSHRDFFHSDGAPAIGLEPQLRRSIEIFARSLTYEVPITHRTWYAYAEPAPVCHNLVHLAAGPHARAASCADYRLPHRSGARVSPRRERLLRQQRRLLFDRRFAPQARGRRREHRRGAPPSTSAWSNRSPGSKSPSLRVTSTRRDAAAGDRWSLSICQLIVPLAPRAALRAARATTRLPASRRSPAGRSYRRPRGAHPSRLRVRPAGTTVHTPLDEVLELPRGVCQDFAHLAIGCAPLDGPAGPLRERLPPHDAAARQAAARRRRRLARLGSAAGAAPLGWIDFDPTNNVLVSDSHITDRLGPRLRRRLPDPGRLRRRRRA